MVIKLFENFKSEENIHKLCSDYNIKNYNINTDGSLDIHGDILLDITEGDSKNDDTFFSSEPIRIPINFNRVSGSFELENNKLTSLNGCPTYVVMNLLVIIIN